MTCACTQLDEPPQLLTHNNHLMRRPRVKVVSTFSFVDPVAKIPLIEGTAIAKDTTPFGLGNSVGRDRGRMRAYLELSPQRLEKSSPFAKPIDVKELFINGLSRAGLPVFASTLLTGIDPSSFITMIRVFGRQIEPQASREKFFDAASNTLVAVAHSFSSARFYLGCEDREYCHWYKRKMEEFFRLIVRNTRIMQSVSLESLGPRSRQMLQRNLFRLSANYYRAVSAMPDYFGIYIFGVLQVGAAAVYLCYLGFVLLMCLLVVNNLTVNARPYLVLMGLLLLQGVCRLLSGIFSLTGSGPSFTIPSLVPLILSDMVAVLSCATLWGFLYLWGSAYHITVGLHPWLWQALLACVVGVSIVTLVAVVAQTLLLYLPSSPFMGSMPLIGGPLVYGMLMIGAIGMLTYSIFLLRHLRYLVRGSNAGEKDFRFRRVREMLVLSAVMAMIFSICFGILTYVAVNRFELMLQDRYIMYRSLVYACGEVFFAVSMCYLMTSLLLGDWISQKLDERNEYQKHRIKSVDMKQSLLKVDDLTSDLGYIPDAYDV